MGSGAQAQLKTNITHGFYKKIKKINTGIEVAEFSWFIVIESLEEIYQANFSAF